MTTEGFWLAERPRIHLYRSADPQRTCGDVADVFRALRFASQAECEAWIAVNAPGFYVAREHSVMGFGDDEGNATEGRPQGLPLGGSSGCAGGDCGKDGGGRNE